MKIGDKKQNRNSEKMIKNIKEVKEILDTCNMHQLLEIRKYIDTLGKQMNKGLETLFR